MISGWRASAPRRRRPAMRRHVGRRADDPVVRVARAARAARRRRSSRRAYRRRPRRRSCPRPSRPTMSSRRRRAPGRCRRWRSSARPRPSRRRTAPRSIDPAAPSRRSRPVAAFQSPVVPRRHARLVAVGGLVVGRGTGACSSQHGHELPVSWRRVAVDVGQRRPVVPPAVRASTKKKSQSCSVSRLTQNDSWRATGRHGDRPRQPLVRRVAAPASSASCSPVRGCGGGRTGRGRSRPSSGSRRPVARRCRTRRSSAVVRYGAIGSRASQVQVVQPPRVASLDEHAVGDASSPRGHGDLERERRLVARVVVGREPGRGDVGLAGDERAVVGVMKPEIAAERRSPTVSGTPS